ncbi:RING-type E3 ubiquitin transferase [Citrus sinensis]|nr:RING-type E3 ubiquitin transferase [Citrus sinensis]
MELDSIECVSSMDGLMDEDEISHHHHPPLLHHHQFASSKPHNNAINNNNAANTNGINGIVGPTAIAPATSVHELLECPVCTNSMYPPIHQRTQLELLLKSISAVLDYELLFYAIYLFYSATMDTHFVPLVKQGYTTGAPLVDRSSEILDCSVVGDIPYLVAHLRDDHKVDMHTGCTFNHRYVKSNPREVENATWMLTVFHCFGQYFCLHFEAYQLGTAPVYMAFLRFMGDETEARSYSYSLEVGGNGRKLSWEGTPRSIRDCHRKVRDSHDGLIIQRNMALFFSGGDRKELKLRVTGRIWKEQQNPDAGVCIPNLCS